MGGDEESSGTRDGELDVRAYSTAQLVDLQRFIDRDAFPLNHATLTAEIERRDRERHAAPPSPAGRFTAHDGWRGWFEAIRRRSPVFGPGELDLVGDEIRLTGSHRTWLGNSAPREFTIPSGEVRNAAVDGGTLRFESRKPWRPRRTIEFQPGTEGGARALLERLPTSRSAGFEKRWRETREFNARLAALRGRQWISIALVIANLAVFIALAIVSRSWAPEPDVTRFIQWGSNYGPVTTGGQWWRLVTALFLHANWPHLLLNMWVLWNVGRLTERLYGAVTFTFLYFASGVCGELARIVWEPAISSIGASGAIFGIVGALLAMLSHPGSRIPRSVAFAYWPSMLAFTLFNLVSGFVNPLVDNAAHVGGLLSGFAFGWLCVRPIDRAQRERFAWRQAIGAGALVLAIGGACFAQLHGVHGRTSVTERFFLAHPWYVRGEHDNLELWANLATRAQTGTISNSEFVDAFATKIIPFWDDAQRKLAAEKPAADQDERALLEMVRDFAKLRLEWAQALRNLADHPDAERAQRVAEIAQKATNASARMQRLSMRSNFDQRPRALANDPWVLRVKGWFSREGSDCVHAPSFMHETPAFSDAYNDGPKARDRAGCRAQRLFVDGDYPALDDLLVKQARSLADLPDGGSSLSGSFNGIDDFIYYGHSDLQTLLGKTSDWRRTVKGSVAAELVEALVFRNWAWTARGHGSYDSVSQEAWELFGARNEMALAGLEDVRAKAATNPYWYSLSLQNAGDRQVDRAHLDEIFDEGVARFPDYLPIYSGRMRDLMPRWGGSVQELETFIQAIAKSGRGQLDPDERYAQLYSIYSHMEDDEINVFAAGEADWTRVQDGFTKLRHRFPRSDLVVNDYAKFACMAGDETVWRSLRPTIASHPASMAWSEKRTIAGCDKTFKAPGAPE